MEKEGGGGGWGRDLGDKGSVVWHRHQKKGLSVGKEV